MTGPALTVRETVDAIRRGEADVREIVWSSLDRARELSGLNAFIAVADDSTIETLTRSGPAELPQAELALAGLPIAVKDSIDVAGFPCTAGTPALRDWRPAEDAGVVSRLREAGAVVVGKNNLHELGIGITSNNPTFGPVRNPYDPLLIAGGSSGGGAAAVAAGVVPLALGADTAGSVRIPASLCGCVGFRPTTGRYPSDGVIPLSHTRDTVGLLTRTVSDAQLVDHVITGAAPMTADLAGRRLGVPRPYFYDDLDDDTRPVIEDALLRLAEAGAVLVETEVPDLAALTTPVSLPLTFYEWPRDLGRYLAAGRCPVSLAEIADAMAGDNERGWLRNELWGNGVEHAQYLDIIGRGRPRVLDAYRETFVRDHLDALVLPTTPLPARPIGQDATVTINGQQRGTLAAYLRNTDPSAVVGLPSITVPAGLSATGLPIGLSFDGLPGHDAPLLALAAAFQHSGPLLPPPSGRCLTTSQRMVGSGAGTVAVADR
ncbi:MAG: amidase family protein [Actinomycetota bacterium]|nr:amidase family protein [Actinomycetota bacterium]